MIRLPIELPGTRLWACDATGPVLREQNGELRIGDRRASTCANWRPARRWLKDDLNRKRHENLPDLPHQLAVF